MTKMAAVQSILFFVPYGEWIIHNQLDALVAAAMKVRGCDVHVITCDGLYQPCALRRGQQDCAFCQAAIAGTLRQWELPSMTIGSLLTPHLIDRAEQWAAALPDDQLAIAGQVDIELERIDCG